MPTPQNPALVQWQLRFDQAVKASQAAGTPDAQRAAAEQLRQLQMSKPTGQPKPAQGRLRSDQGTPAPPSGGLSPMFNYIRNALSGAGK